MILMNFDIFITLRGPRPSDIRQTSLFLSRFVFFDLNRMKIAIKTVMKANFDGFLIWGGS